MTRSDPTTPLGLIAGEGAFPLLVARGARAAGRKVVCAGLAGCAWPMLSREVDAFRSVGVLRFGSWIRHLRSHGCTEAIMVGYVPKDRMFSRWRYLQYIPDWRALRLWFVRLRDDKRPQAVLQGLIDELHAGGITLIDSTRYCSDQLATPGVMTRRQPTEKQWGDIHHGWRLAQTVTRLDIGQSIAVMDRDILAVEAIEGTNAMIERAGALCRAGGWTLIKVSNSTRDMRVDVPTIGTTTIEKLYASGARCLVLEAGKTIMLEKPKIIELADRYKIAIVGQEAIDREGT